LQPKESSIRKLRAHIATLKGKNVSDKNVPLDNVCVIAPRIFKLDLEPLSNRLKNNREAHEDYLHKTKEHTDTLHGLAERARKQNPSDPHLDYALIPSTSTSGSQSKNSTRKNRITLAASSNKNNKTVEARPRKVMYSLNKKNHVSLCNANFKHDVKDVNSKFVCSTCNGCLFSANHDKCVVTYINDVNKCVKSKSSKSKKIEWKPTGKVFTNVGHRSSKSSCDMMRSSPICLLSKASKTKSWLWHRRLSYFNFGTINELAKQGLVKGLPKLKYEKDHLCYACSLRKSKKHTLKPKFEDTIQEKLYLLHMDLCGPMRIKSINGNKYILVLVDDYSRLLDNGTEFVNQTLKSYYEDVGISHQTSVACTPRQNNIVERRNSILVEANPPSTPMFDEYFNPPPSVVSPVRIAIAPRPTDPTGSPLSTSIDQAVPSPSSQESSSTVQLSNPPLERISKWTKIHPLENVIDNPSRPVSTWKQLQTDAMWCFFDAFLTSVKPNNFNEAMLESSWIDAMQEEISRVQMIGCLGACTLSSDPVDTLLVEKTKLDANLQGKPVDPTHYRGMIGSLIYLTSSRPDLVFAVCMCARYQARPTKKHLYAVKRIFQ
ncbi:retrovirus-related pol polyprotein from transposon TNT 1-94, partial [Tanacetum coccineum]